LAKQGNLLRLFLGEGMINTTKKSEIKAILNRVLNQPHQLETRVWFRKAFTFLLQLTEKEVIIDAFDPKFINKFVKHGTKFHMTVAEVDKMYEFVYTFTLQVIRISDFNGALAYVCKMPTNYQVKTTEIVIEPEQSDNVTIGFKLGDHDFLRKVLYISRDEIGIEGDFDKYKDYLGSTVYNIELKLPFHRVKISADIILDSEENFCFHEYAITPEVESAVSLYAKDMFYRDYSLYERLNTVEESSIPAEEIIEEVENVEDEIKEEKTKIFVADDKTIIAEFIKRVLVSRTNYEIYTETDPDDIVPVLKEVEPDLMIIDYDMPGTSLDSILGEIEQIESIKSNPVLVMDSNPQDIDYMDFHVTNTISKPIDSTELLAKIEDALQSSGVQEKILDKHVVICTDQTDLRRKLVAVLERHYITCHEIDNPSRMINIPPKEDVDLIFIFLRAKLLPIVTKLKSLKNYRNTKIMAIPRAGTDLKNLKTKNYSDLFVLGSIPDKDELIREILKILEV
jgi:CheY-like chemotaxis protein